MGYLGDNLEDYCPDQLMDEIIYQLNEGASGDLNKLMARLMIVNELVMAMKLEDKKLNETQK